MMHAAATPAAAPSAADVPDHLVFTDGDGRIPRAPVADWQPHGTSNVVSLAVLPHDLRVVLTGSADRRLHGTLVRPAKAAAASELPLEPLLLASLALPAPALTMVVCPRTSPAAALPSDSEGTRSGLLAAGLMDGSLAVVEWTHHGSASDDGGGHTLALRLATVLRTHAKYTSRVAFSADGSLLATASHDGSVCVFAVAHGPPGRAHATSGVRLRLLQRVYWGPAASVTGDVAPVEAIAWAPLRPLSPSSADATTLIVAVRGSPTLQYLSVLPRGSEALAAVGLDARSSHALPVLQPSEAERAAEADAAGGALLSLLPLIVLHRVPLSEDGGPASMFRSPGRGGASEDAQGGAATSAPLLITPGESRGSDAAAAGIRVAPDSSAAAHASSGAPSQFSDFASPPVAVAGGEGAGSLVTPRPLEDRTEGGRFIPVGFNIVDLAVSPPPSGAAFPLVAAAADNGVIFVFRLGSNAVLRRLVGHRVGSEFSAGTRVAWWPAAVPDAEGSGTQPSNYVIATSEGDFSAVVYSIGSQRAVARLGLGQALEPALQVAAAVEGGGGGGGDDAGASPHRHSRGHSASIKAVVCARPRCGSASAAGGKAVLLTAGFDKRVIVWSE